VIVKGDLQLPKSLINRISSKVDKLQRDIEMPRVHLP
jgi:hypothetical protein